MAGAAGPDAGRLDGKVAFVSGAGGGIGSALCARFIAEGARVAAADVDLGRAVQAVAGAPSERAAALACDVTNVDDVRGAIGRMTERFGKHLFGTFACCKCPVMRR